MDRVTQNNASQTEEMSGTAASLLDHAEQLRVLVGQFRLDQDRSETAPRTARRTTNNVMTVRPTAASGIVHAGRSAEAELENASSQIGQLMGSGFMEF